MQQTHIQHLSPSVSTPSIRSSPSHSHTHMSSSQSQQSITQSSLPEQPAARPKEPVTRTRRNVAVKLSSRQLEKLRRDITITQRHVEVFSELLSELVPGEEHPEDVALLTQVAGNTQEMQGRVMELVSQVVDHQDITVTLLEINDKMNSEMARYQRYSAKSANKSNVKDPEVFDN